MRTLSAVSLLISIVLLSHRAMAFDPQYDCAKRPKDPVQAQMTAGQLFADAEAQYQQSHPIDALKTFLCSHDIIQHENTLFNIAQIAKITDYQDQALNILKDYVDKSVGDNKIGPIQDIIDEIEKEESNASETTGPIEPTTGEPTESDEIEPSGPIALPAQEDKKGLRIASFVLLGTGGASLIAGGLLQGLAGAAQGRAESTDLFTDFQNERQKMKVMQIGAIAGFAAGGLLVGSGLALLFISKKQSERDDKLVVTLGPAPQGLTLFGRFQ